MEILPIGSMIEVNGVESIIMGYHRTQEKQIKFYYILGLFPFGYVGNDKMILFPVDSEYNIVFRGYEDEEGRKYLRQRTEIIKTLNNRSIDELNDILNEVIKIGKRESR